MAGLSAIGEYSIGDSALIAGFANTIELPDIMTTTVYLTLTGSANMAEHGDMLKDSAFVIKKGDKVLNIVGYRLDKQNIIAYYNNNPKISGVIQSTTNFEATEEI